MSDVRGAKIGNFEIDAKTRGEMRWDVWDGTLEFCHLESAISAFCILHQPQFVFI